MDIEAYIASGILENYCMGFCTEAEKAEVEKQAAKYARIQQEINHIRSVFEEYLLANKVEPSSQVKIGVMEAIYRQQSGATGIYPPLLKQDTTGEDIIAWLDNHPVKDPEVPYDNLFMVELPSTPTVTNFMVWAKYGHETEMHTDFTEYLYVVKGSCRMYFENIARDYKTGEVICIPPNISHNAVITSDLPMVAIVQRQACA